MMYIVSIVTDSSGFDININDLFVTKDRHKAAYYVKRFNRLMRIQRRKSFLYADRNFKGKQPFMFNYVYYYNPQAEFKEIEER